MALLLQMADAMFPEGQGAPRAMAKVDAAAEKSIELLVNAKEARSTSSGGSVALTRRSQS